MRAEIVERQKRSGAGIVLTAPAADQNDDYVLNQSSVQLEEDDSQERPCVEISQGVPDPKMLPFERPPLSRYD